MNTSSQKFGASYNYMDFIALSHLRWDFVYQRPQHLLSRCAQKQRVFFWEEPVYTDTGSPKLRVRKESETLDVLTPELPSGLEENAGFQAQSLLLEDFLCCSGCDEYALWYYTPTARAFTRELEPVAVIYDCMDELSAFRGAPPGLREAESELLEAADLVFTGGRSLYDAKKNLHPSVHCFPSSIDVGHFATARYRFGLEEPEDQVSIPHPRVGFCGVIDERANLPLLAEMAAMKPEWHFVMLGPVAKISDADLPKPANIHYLGNKKYADLPRYMASWDVAMMPFARNQSTRFISPTKTPEYLAAGLPVVSTSITDVIRPYGELGLIEIADSAAEFVAALERLQEQNQTVKAQRSQRVDEFLAQSSWDRTWSEMEALIVEVAEQRKQKESIDDKLQVTSSTE